MQIKNKVKTLKTADVDTFLAWDFNTLKDPKRDVTKLKQAILKGGFSFPVIVWKNYVIDGAGRKKAIEELLKDGHEIKEIPYVEIEAKDLKEAKQKALEVSSQFGNITKDSFLQFTSDLELDFGTFEIAGIKSDMFIDKSEEDDEVPELPKKAQSKAGDIYELGSHRVMCGDATDPQALYSLCGANKVDMYLTDPPYNVDYEGKTKEALTIKNDKMADNIFQQFLIDAFKNADLMMKKGAVFYIWHADSEGYNFRGGCKTVGWLVRQCLIWNKNSMVMGRQDYHWQHEPCLYGWKDGAAHLWNTDRTQTTMLNFNRPSRSAEHPTMKPVELLMYQITNNTKEGDIVLDSFLGSGSTLIGAEKSGRVCYGLELDPKYVDVIVQRYVDFTGNENIIKNGKPLLWRKKIKMQ